MNHPNTSMSIFPNSHHFHVEKCQICGQKAQGKHYGALACRACAAFFRRVGATNSVKPCKKSNRCTLSVSGWFNCKKCRLEKCREVGMTVESFQYCREPSNAFNTMKIPTTINTLLGETNLILFSNRKTPIITKAYIDMGLVLEKARCILETGRFTPLKFENSSAIKKLAFGLDGNTASIGCGSGFGTRKEAKHMIMKMGKEEFLAIFHQNLFKVAKWLTYFDAVHQLPIEIQLTLLKSTWQVWCRMEHAIRTARARRQEVCGFNQVVVDFPKKRFVADLSKMEIDLTWCSRFTAEQVKFFHPEDSVRTSFEKLIETILDVQPTDEELSFLLCHICFHYAKQQHEGEVLKVVECLEEMIFNDLHRYYVNELNLRRYSVRLAKLMKISSKMQEIFYREKVQKELAAVFDLFNVEFSHPEMFKYGGCGMDSS